MSFLKASALICIGAACYSMAGAAVADDNVRVLTKSSNWNVDFAPDKCRLAAIFGPENEKHMLFFEQHYPNSEAGLTLAGPALDQFRSRGKTMLSFYPEQKPLRTAPFMGDLNTIGSAVIYSNVHLEHGTEDMDDDLTRLPQLDTELAANVKYVSVEQRGREVRFATGRLGEAFEVLNQCTQDMLRDWGLDPAQHLSASQMPKWTNEQAVSRRIASQYPRQALRSGEQAILRLRVIVSESGRVEKCVISGATTTDRLESPACKEMKKAKFDPALDADGNPFRSFYATSVIYQIGT